MPKPCNASNELSDIILKACAYIPSERYSSAKEMRKDLERMYEIEKAKSLDVKERVDNKTFENEVTVKKINENEHTLNMFGGKKNVPQSFYEDSQEKTVFLKQEKERPILTKRTEEKLEREKVAKQHRKLYIVLTGFVILIAMVLLVVWGKNKPEQTSVVEEHTENIISSTVSNPVVTEKKEFVPNTVGMEWKKAKNVLESIGLFVKVDKEYHSSVKKGIVISQSVNVGTIAEEGEQVTLVVSKGKKNKTVVKPTVEPTEKTISNSTDNSQTSSERQQKQTITTQKPSSTTSTQSNNKTNKSEKKKTSKTQKPSSIVWEPDNDTEENDSSFEEWKPDE